MKKFIAIVLMVAMLASVITVGVSAETITADTSWYTDAAYTANGNKYLLDDAADVLGFSNLLAGIGVDAPVNFEGKNVELTADVDLQGNTWGLLVGAISDDSTRPESKDPLAFAVLQNYGFWGTFDGKGHTISGINFDGYESDDNDAHDCCLFGIVPAGKTATVKNLAIKSSRIEVSYYSSCIFSTIEGTATVDSVWLCADTALVGSGQTIGALVGRVMPSGTATVKNCVIECVHVDTWGKDRLRGGIVGASYGNLTIEDCAMYGTMTKTYNPLGARHAGLVQTVAKSASYAAEGYAPALTVKNVIVYGNIADSYDPEGTTLNRVTYFMEPAGEGVAVEMSNLLYVQTSKELRGVEGTKIDSAAITGTAAQTLLTEKGMTNWSAYGEEKPVPTTVFNFGFIHPNGTIAITEICATPDDDRFEFVEVMNASEVEINLNNYTVARFGFDHGGNWAASGLGQLMGWSGNLQDLNALPLTQDVALKKNEVALLWFVTQANASLTVENFKAYWESKGNDMSNVTVIKVVHSAPASNIYSYCGDNFLPDQKSGFAVSMIKTAKCAGTVGSYTWADLKTTNTSSIATAETAKVHQLADCIALQYNTSTADTVNSRNYYGFVDLDKYNAAATPTVDGKNITRKTPLASALTGNADPLIATYVNNGSSDGYTYVEDGEKELPTPGALRDGQFAVSTDLGVYAAQYRTDGDTQSVRFVGYVEGTDYKEVGFWINATYTDGGNKVTKSLKVLATQTVYQNITAGGKTVGVSEATNETYSEGYLMAIAVSGLPLENTTNITFYVTPYGITADGRTVVGSQVTHTLQNSAS